MLHEYHVIYSVWYYTRFHVTAVGLGTYYLQIWGHYYSFYGDCVVAKHRVFVVLEILNVSAERGLGALGLVIVQHKVYSVPCVIAKCCDAVSQQYVTKHRYYLFF
jgi:hypothetical protein